MISKEELSTHCICTGNSGRLSEVTRINTETARAQTRSPSGGTWPVVGGTSFAFPPHSSVWRMKGRTRQGKKRREDPPQGTEKLCWTLLWPCSILFSKYRFLKIPPTKVNCGLYRLNTNWSNFSLIFIVTRHFVHFRQSSNTHCLSQISENECIRFNYSLTIISAVIHWERWVFNQLTFIIIIFQAFWTSVATTAGCRRDLGFSWRDIVKKKHRQNAVGSVSWESKQYKGLKTIFISSIFYYWHFFDIQCWFKLTGQNLTFQTRFSQIGLKLDKNWTEQKLITISPALIWCNFFSEMLNQNSIPKIGHFLIDQELSWNYLVNRWENYITRSLLHRPTKF